MRNDKTLDAILSIALCIAIGTGLALALLEWWT